MQLDFATGARKSADVIVVPMWQDKKKPELACEAKEFAKAIAFPIQNGDFLGKEGETLLLYPENGNEKRLLLVGLGLKEKCHHDTLRRAYASAVKAINAKKLKSANFLFPTSTLMGREILCKAVVEGVLLTNYAFNELKGQKDGLHQLQKAHFCGLNKKESALLEKTQIIISAVNFARDLVNGNADDVTVDMLSKTAMDLAKKSPKIKTTVLDHKRLEKEKMGLHLAVGQGAKTPPALVIIEYRGDPKSKELTALVGKGITYDTGGLNLKPTGGMETMKCDMAGSAAVIGTLKAAAEMGLKKNLLGVLALAENAIGPGSYKPGDVYKSHQGLTVEISNTDAEGRLVLADAMSYIQKHYSPTRMIDIATLTGGVVVALGEDISGFFSTDDKLAKQLVHAGERTHDRVWRLPLLPEYKDLLKSSIADIKNSGARKASPCQGGIFLLQFVKDIPWAHIDVAGTAYLSELKGYHTTPATGAGIRLLIDFLEHDES